MSFSTDDRRPPAECMTMAEVRQGVDALDRLLVTVLAERQRYMNAAARIKPNREAVRDTARIEDVVAKVKAAARAHDETYSRGDEEHEPGVWRDAQLFADALAMSRATMDSARIAGAMSLRSSA